MKRPSSTDALNQAQAQQLLKEDAQLKQVYRLINAASNHAQTSQIVFQDLYLNNINSLKAAGYQVNLSYARDNEQYYTIVWGTALS